MKILITGSSGLVGTAIKDIFSETENELINLTSKDCDLTDYDSTLKTFTKHKPQTIIHLAALVGGLYKNMNHKVDMFEKNLIMNYNVVKCAHLAGVTNLVGCLSTCIFPDDIKYPISEHDLHLGAPHSSNYGYAYAKRSLETHCALYREKYNLNYFCIIPTNIYGENDNFNLKDSHVIPGLIHKCYLAKLKHKPFTILGTGKPLRQFIYSRDIAKLIKILLELPESFKLKNIILSVPPKHEVSISHISKLIARCFDYESMITYDTTKNDGQYKKTASNTYLTELLTQHNIDFKFTPIEVGISKAVKWFVSNYDTARK